MEEEDAEKFSSTDNQLKMLKILQNILRDSSTELDNEDSRNQNRLSTKTIRLNNAKKFENLFLNNERSSNLSENSNKIIPKIVWQTISKENIHEEYASDSSKKRLATSSGVQLTLFSPAHARNSFSKQKNTTRNYTSSNESSLSYERESISSLNGENEFERKNLSRNKKANFMNYKCDWIEKVVKTAKKLSST